MCMFALILDAVGKERNTNLEILPFSPINLILTAYTHTNIRHVANLKKQ